MKRYKQQWLLRLLLPLVLISSFSCKKFLDRKPLGSGIEEDISGNPQEALENQVFGLYAGTRNWGITGLPFLVLNSMRSDDSWKGSIPADGADIENIADNFQYTKDHWMLNAYWEDHYNFISLANNVIHTVDSLHLTDQASLTNKGEAMFMRAWAYFDLVRTYGEVPKIDFKIITPAQANIAKSSVADIYALIDADLQFAAQHLPLSWETRFTGRITRGSANTLMAKTLLQRSPANWSAALAKCEEVINSHKYELEESYARNFTEPGENSKESIFEVQNFESTNGSQWFSNEFAMFQGVRGGGDWDLGWGWNVPTANLFNSYEANDPRKTATILVSGQPDGSFGDIVPAGLAQPYWNKKVYTDPNRRRQTSDRFGRWLNMVLIRYADVLLMAAESANELGGPANTTKALGYLEEVRKRARGNSIIILPEVTTTNQGLLREAIHKERRAEFAMEYERFFDLVRWGTAQAVLGPLGYQPRNMYYPIPQPFIDRSGNTLTQNPAY